MEHPIPSRPAIRLRLIRIATLSLLAFPFAPNASRAAPSDVERLHSAGYRVVAETEVKGEFTGCEFDQRINFVNGMIFVCLSDRLGQAYRPGVTILQHGETKDVRVVIDGEEFRGSLYASQ